MSVDWHEPITGDLQILIYIIITYKTLRNEISRKSDDELLDPLDGRCQRRKAHNCEACRTHSSGLEQSVYDSHADRYGFNSLVA